MFVIELGAKASLVKSCIDFYRAYTFFTEFTWYVCIVFCFSPPSWHLPPTTLRNLSFWSCLYSLDLWEFIALSNFLVFSRQAFLFWFEGCSGPRTYGLVKWSIRRFTYGYLVTTSPSSKVRDSNRFSQRYLHLSVQMVQRDPEFSSSNSIGRSDGRCVQSAGT